MEKVTDKQYWIDSYLKAHLDSICRDAHRDFDFLIIVTGDGEVRVGKSVMAQQAAYYCAWKLGRPFDIDGCSNIVFSGKELITQALKFPKQVLIYDEARAELDAKKTLQHVSQVLQDFFAECGKLNHIVFLVLPDFFELNRRIATTRSESLINVFLTRKPVKENGADIISRERGGFFYYTKDLKKKLYILGKKDMDNYDAVKSAFWGSFTNTWIANREAYEKKKDAFLKRDREVTRQPRQTIQRNILIKYLYDKCNLTQQEIANIMSVNGINITQQLISEVISGFKDGNTNT